MNNIKFRAWDKIDNLMRTVTTYYFYDEYVCLDENPAGRCETRSLDKVEIMQSTGQFDLNNKEIFIGDIIECDYINPNRKDNKTKKMIITIDHICFGNYSKGDIANFNVIGNKYENPELCSKN